VVTLLTQQHGMHQVDAPLPCELHPCSAAPALVAAHDGAYSVITLTARRCASMISVMSNDSLNAFPRTTPICYTKRLKWLLSTLKDLAWKIIA
jgi:hypothetical protein